MLWRGGTGSQSRRPADGAPGEPPPYRRPAAGVRPPSAPRAPTGARARRTY